MKSFFVVLGLIYQIKLSVSQGCLPNICENNGSCVEEPSQVEGYRCQCAADYHGKKCSNKLPDVECLSDRIVLTVQKSLVVEEVNTVRNHFVYLGKNQFDSRECFSKDEGSDLVVTMMPPFQGQCGTIAREDSGGKLKFSNRLFLDTTRDDNVTNSHRMVLLDWSCEYESRYAVSYPYAIQYSANRPERQVVYGKFTLDMSVYRSPLLIPDSKLTPPVDTNVSERLFVQVDLLTSQQPDLVVTYRSCVATNAPDPSNNQTTFSHELLSSGCPSRLDPSVELHQSGNSTKSLFSFVVFQWTNNQDPIYIHCVVSVCNITRFADECKSTCVTPLRKRREIDDVGEPDVTLTVGPIHIKNTHSNFDLLYNENRNSSENQIEIMKDQISPESSNQAYLILGILSGVGFLFIITLCVFIYLKRASNNQVSSKSDSVRTISSGITIEPRVRELPPINNRV